MKARFFTTIFALAMLLIGTAATAQFDDVYYDPDTDDSFYGYEAGYDGYNEYAYDDDEYEHYDEYDDYDYYYSSRIRRFHRPYNGFGYYDPCYTNAYSYDPFFSGFPGTSIYISFGNNFGHRGFRRYARYGNFYGSPYYGHNPFFNPYFGGNPYNQFYGNNYWGYNNYYGYNNPYFNGCNPGYNGYGYAGGGSGWNSGWNNSSGTTSNVYYGSRHGGSTKSSSNGPVRSPKLNSNPSVKQTDIGKTTGRTLKTEPGVSPNDIEAADRISKAPRTDKPVKSNNNTQTERAPRTTKNSVQTERAPKKNRIYETDRAQSTQKSAPRVKKSAEGDRRSSTRSSAPKRSNSSSTRSYTPEKRKSSSTRSSSSKPSRSSSTRSSSRSSNRSSSTRSSSNKPSRSSSTRSSSRSSNRSSSTRSSSGSSRSSSTRSSSRGGGSKRGN